MKKILLILSAAIVLFAGCTKEEEKGDYPIIVNMFFSEGHPLVFLSVLNSAGSTDLPPFNHWIDENDKKPDISFCKENGFLSIESLTVIDKAGNKIDQNVDFKHASDDMILLVSNKNINMSDVFSKSKSGVTVDGEYYKYVYEAFFRIKLKWTNGSEDIINVRKVIYNDRNNYGRVGMLSEYWINNVLIKDYTIIKDFK